MTGLGGVGPHLIIFSRAQLRDPKLLTLAVPEIQRRKGTGDILVVKISTGASCLHNEKYLS